MAYADFIASPKGRLIDQLLRGGLADMERFSAAGRPALLAVAPRIADVAPDLTDTEKQHIGRHVHRLIGPRGWRPARKTRLPKGSLFTTAAVYEPAAKAADRVNGAEDALHDSVAARFAAARAILANSATGTSFTVDDFIADKRAEVRRERRRDARRGH